VGRVCIGPSTDGGDGVAWFVDCDGGNTVTVSMLCDGGDGVAWSIECDGTKRVACSM